MDTRILAEAKKDIPLYLNDFESYWNSVVNNINDSDLIDCYHATLIYKIGNKVSITCELLLWTFY